MGIVALDYADLRFCSHLRCKGGITWKTDGWLDYAICITWFVYIVVVWNSNASDFVRTFYTMGGPVLSTDVFEAFHIVWTGVTMAVTVLFLGVTGIATMH